VFFLAPGCSSWLPGILGVEVNDGLGWFLETLVHGVALLGC
jgi:hypothetical protein